MYEGCLYKIESSLAEILDKPKPQINDNNSYLKNISTTYDKLCIPFSVLKLSPAIDDLTIIYNTNFDAYSIKPSAPTLLNSNTNGNTYVTNTSIQMPQPIYIPNSSYSTLVDMNSSLSFQSLQLAEKKSIIEKNNEILTTNEYSGINKN